MNYKVIEDNVTNNIITYSDVNQNNVTNNNFKNDNQKNINNVKNTYIENAFWISNPVQQMKINFLAFKEDNLAYFKIIFSKSAIGKKVKIRIFDLDNLVDDELLSYQNTVNDVQTIFKFDISGKIFCRGYDSILKLYVNLEIDQLSKNYCKGSSDLLKIHVVRYIPQIMEANRFFVGATLQKKWHEGKANNNYKNTIDITTIRFNYFLKFIRFSEFVDEAQNSEKWYTENSKKLLIKRINDNIKIKKYNLPSDEEAEMKFGITSKKMTKDEKGVNVPEFENNYMQTLTYEESMFSPIDDLYCSLATFKIKLIPLGSIKNIGGSKAIITINKLALYVDDDFSFNGDESLGCWSPYHNKINKIDCENNTFYKISDSSFREYRDLGNIGNDFRIFSDLHFVNVNETLEANIVFDENSKKTLLQL